MLPMTQKNNVTSNVQECCDRLFYTLSQVGYNRSVDACPLFTTTKYMRVVNDICFTVPELYGDEMESLNREFPRFSYKSGQFIVGDL